MRGAACEPHACRDHPVFTAPVAAARPCLRYDLWAAAFLIEGWWCDDASMDFRDGLISLGRHRYEHALADPDSLADRPTGGDGEDALIGNEDFSHVAHRAYQRLTGEPDGLSEALEASPEAGPLSAMTEPAGTRWDVADDDEMRRHLPRLAGIFLDSYSSGGS
ncbi:DUF4240 domain-containing protein [Streptomyces sp. NPDC001714]|uniref:DUF4240 domain-containing protein n=1 Tax=Streptomyces sp. NPDC001714 TaxID=3364603 RepID=UPI0036A8DEEF